MLIYYFIDRCFYEFDRRVLQFHRFFHQLFHYSFLATSDRSKIQSSDTLEGKQNEILFQFATDYIKEEKVVLPSPLEGTLPKYPG